MKFLSLDLLTTHQVADLKELIYINYTGDIFSAVQPELESISIHSVTEKSINLELEITNSSYVSLD